MAEQWNHAPLLKLVSELAATWQTATKKVAGWYIDVGERLVKETVELQKRVTDWATDTSWIPLVEEQNTITDEFISGQQTWPADCGRCRSRRAKKLRR